MSKEMIQTIEKFQIIKNNLPKMLKESDFKAKFFYKKLEISKSTYYRKLKDNDFTTSEMITLLKALM